MRRLRRLMPAVRRDTGFTLIELLVACTLLTLVMLGAFAALDSTQRAATRDTDRAESMRTVQVSLDRMVREIRHTRSVVDAGTHVLEVDIFRRGALRRVRYDCRFVVSADPSLRQCKRIEGSNEVVIFDRVRPAPGDPPVFSYAPTTAPRHITVNIRAAVDEGRASGYDTPLLLTSGTSLRNAQ